MMKIGLLSDTHDNLPKIEKAVKLFNKKKVDFVLHAGDFVAPFSIPELKKLSCGWCGVFGNNDGEKEGLSKKSEGRVQEGPLRIDLDNRRIVLVHDIEKINPEIDDAELIIFGHTHRSEIKQTSSRLIINPGECGGWLTGKSSVAIVDLATLSSRIFRI